MIFQVSTVAIVPTRLESLQVLSTIAQRYFDAIIVPSLSIVTNILSLALEDNSTEICLHAARCVGSIGDAIQCSGEEKKIRFHYKIVRYATGN